VIESNMKLSMLDRTLCPLPILIPIPQRRMEANLGEQLCQVSKSGHPRHVVLADDRTAPFGAQRSRARVALAFTRNRIGIVNEAPVRDARGVARFRSRHRGVSVTYCPGHPRDDAKLDLVERSQVVPLGQSVTAALQRLRSP
jgi:hypothetical protein